MTVNSATGRSITTIGAAAALTLALTGAGTAAPVFDWTGFYAGVFGGANMQQADIPTYEGVWYGSYYYYSNSSKPLAVGAELGGDVGFNQQFGSFVLGAEGDINWSSNTVLVDTYGNYATAALSWMSTLRLRAGVVVGDSALIYATAGLAAANIDYSVCEYSSCTGSYDYGTSGVRLGLTGGVGAEVAINDNTTIDAKLLYTSFASSSMNTPYYYYPATFQSNVVSARVGLNWHMD